ncbi:MAG: FAD-binding oxidoreductase [Pseudomonadota bacterium]
MNAIAQATSLQASLEAALPPGTVSSNESIREFAAHDVYRRGATPILVIRPTSVADLQTAVRLVTSAGCNVVARGGGASYTDGYVPTDDNTVSFDLAALNKIVAIDATNMTVTVEAGCTWADLHSALAAQQLRTPFFGPFSGIAASVGGSVSQHAVSHGSGRYGPSADSVLSVDVVLANGALLRTGSAAFDQADDTQHAFFRHNGPDITGLFCGDCGAFGIKARVTLPLIKAPPYTEALSFHFDSFRALHAAMRDIAALGLDDENFGLDAALQQGQIARNAATKQQLGLAWQVFHRAPSVWQGLKSIVAIAVAGDRHLREPGYAVSYIVKGHSDKAARHNASSIRAAALPHGHEVPNTVPRVVASLPFAPLENVLGPNGERWVPIHGIVAHDQAVSFHDRFSALMATYEDRCQTHGVWTGAMFQAIGSSAFLYEIAFYWPDELQPYHAGTLDEAFLKRVPKHAPNAAAAALVDELKEKAIALYSEIGAVHMQIGKAYPFAGRLSPPSNNLLQSIKTAVDPQRVMNPNALGL